MKLQSCRVVEWDWTDWHQANSVVKNDFVLDNHFQTLGSIRDVEVGKLGDCSKRFLICFKKDKLLGLAVFKNVRKDCLVPLFISYQSDFLRTLSRAARCRYRIDCPLSKPIAAEHTRDTAAFSL